LSETEAPSRTDSPAGRPYKSTIIVAQKKQGPFPSANVYSSLGRSSWKKSWGIEPPGWQSRPRHFPTVTPDIYGPSRKNLRDVFSSRQPRQSLGGDESDWVDEDDEPPVFDGGVGQAPTTLSSKPLVVSNPAHPPSPLFKASELKPLPNRPKRSSPTPGNEYAIPRPSLLPSSNVITTEVLSTSVPEPNATRARRQLPSGRNGPAFRGHAIVEEDEDEEE
jgi:hypothetical protein